MADVCSNSPATTIKSSTSESHGIKGKVREPLLEENKVATIPNSDDKEPESITMPDHPFRILPDINLYQNKKTMGTGMMDLALLVTNANQLRHIFSSFETSSPYFYITLTMVSISIVLQIVVGIFLAINSRYDVKNCDDICKADRINNWITALIFLITAINVVIPTLGVPEF